MSHPQQSMAEAGELNVDEAHDSGIEDVSSTQSTSVRSSVLEYTYENGRRYNAYRSGEYTVPNDETEQDRMDLLHHIYRMMLGGDLLQKPPKEPRLILDIGTGTGIWAIDIADEFPEAVIIGTDISPIQPSWIPPNCQFYIDDAEATEWTYENCDLIHGRSLGGAVADWPRFFRQCLTALKPGGLIEMQDHDGWIDTIEPTKPPWTADWTVTLSSASERFGKAFNTPKYYAGWMRDAGFVDVEDKILPVPIGTWAKGKDNKELGKLHLWQMLSAVESYTPALYTRVLGKTVDETNVTIEMVKKEFCTKRYHLYVNYHFITGRRPL